MNSATPIKRSSNIHGCYYDPATNTLGVNFKGADGKVTSSYEYSGVSLAQYESFMASDSKGQWFAHHIRNAKHPHTGEPLHPARRLK